VFFSGFVSWGFFLLVGFVFFFLFFFFLGGGGFGFYFIFAFKKGLHYMLVTLYSGTYKEDFIDSTKLMNCAAQF